MHDEVTDLTWRAGLDPENEHDRFKVFLAVAVGKPLRCATCDELHKPLCATTPDELLHPDYDDAGDYDGWNMEGLMEGLRAFHERHQGHALEAVEA